MTPVLKKTLLSWILTIPFFFLFIFLLVLFDIIYRISILFGQKIQERVLSWHNYFMMNAMQVTGAKISLPELPKMDLNKPIILVCNHQSMMDIPIIHSLFKCCSPRFVSKKELAKFIPFVSIVLRNGGHALIDRKNRSQAIQSIVNLAKKMQTEKFALAIFPEGTRARDGILKDFKPGGLNSILAEIKDAQILPVAIDGTWKFTYFNLLPVPQNLKITVRCGNIIQYDGVTGEIAKQAQQQISLMLQKIRNEK